MLYYELIFGGVFLPFTMIAYQICPKRFRWVLLLLASIGFYFSFSIKLTIYVVITATLTYATGMILEKIAGKRQKALDDLKSVPNSENDESKTNSTKSLKEEKAAVRARYQTKLRLVFYAGVLIILGILLYLKYYNFFAENVNLIAGATEDAPVLPLKTLLLPLGISFYTMQAISYMTDIYWGKLEAQRNPFKLLLFLCFTPTIIEGPIALYRDMKDKIYVGDPIDPDNVIRGYTRFIWGVMKKLVIADRLYPAVTLLFDPTHETKGFEVVAAAVIFTIMEYMDFSGCMDMVIGIGCIFGIDLPENFRQPFLARNASEFWRRWHISLGVWFKTYIFYPVSMSTISKKWGKFARGRVNKHLSMVVTSAIALFPVWICNGIWHGPKWTYIFFGVFYLIVLLLELLFEPLGDKILKLFHTTKENKIVNVIRILKTWVIIFAGELFFRADTLREAFRMIKDIGVGFTLKLPWGEDGTLWYLDRYDWIIVIVMLVVVGIINILREKDIDVMKALLKKPLVLRWALILALLLVLTIFGCYGPGYEEVDLIYAGF